MEFKHISVLFEESICALNPVKDGIYVDGTLGGGGHSYGLFQKQPEIRLIGIDRDEEALSAASGRLAEFSDRITLVHSNYANIEQIVADLGIEKIDGAILDLGVSSYQLDNPERGFGYMQDSPLDMRMDRSATNDAYNVVNTYSEDELAGIFYAYGEEKWSKRIAEFIAARRVDAPIKTTGELVEIIKAAIPKAARMEGGHPAKRVFQAIRIEVNEELSLLEGAIRGFINVLRPGGRLAIISFHSLEDRIVKKTFADLATPCTCPRDFPICVCGRKPIVKIIEKKPVLPSADELAYNPRSKSAKLRVIEKLGD